MAVKFTNGIELSKTSLLNAVLHPVGSNPTTPVDGQVWYRTDTDRLMVQANGTAVTVAHLSEIPTDAPGVSTGATAPGTTPTTVGDIYIDTTANLAYVATGTATSADWDRIIVIGDNPILDADFSGGEGLMRKTGSGTYQVVKTNLAATVAPTINEDSGDGYAVGSIWINTTADEAYIAMDVTVGAAVWGNITTDAGAGATNLTYTAAPTNGVVASDTGTDATLTLATGTNAGLLAPGDFTKLGNTSGTNTGDELAASDTVAGVVELATILETQTGTDAARAVTPDGLQGVTDVSGMAWVIDEDTMVTNTAARVPTQQSVKAYVDAQVASSLTYKGAYNASTNSPLLDATPIAGILTGDTYTVTVAGTFFTEAVEVGDVLIAEIDSPTLLADWTVVNRNIDAASATVPGIVELAIAAEVTTGTDATRAITPQALAGSDYTRSYVVDVGNGAANPVTITHNLGTKDVVVSLREVVGDAHVFADVVSATVNTITLGFATIPTAAQYRVTVVG